MLCLQYKIRFACVVRAEDRDTLEVTCGYIYFIFLNFIYHVLKDKWFNYLLQSIVASLNENCAEALLNSVLNKQ
jgi:hypothetical protein